MTISYAESLRALLIPFSPISALQLTIYEPDSGFLGEPEQFGNIIPRVGFGYAKPQYRTRVVVKGIRHANNNEATSECQDCKIFVKTKYLRHRDYDGLLVCPECNFVTPIKIDLVGPDSLSPKVTNPPKVPDPPAPIVPGRQDMRVKPDYRRI